MSTINTTPQPGGGFIVQAARMGEQHEPQAVLALLVVAQWVLLESSPKRSIPTT